jgi:hypothetical protein
MSRREEYSEPLKCPACGREGRAAMSDRRSYKIEDFDTRVDAVTEGFEAISTPQNPHRRYDVICDKCKVSALGSATL